MGNYASCALCGPNADERDRAEAKVIFPRGEIQSVSEPITAAEFMLENPNSFLVNSKSLQIGRRFSPLNADEDIKMGNVYVLFPKQRLYSVVNAADMGALFLAAKRNSSSASSGSKFKRVDDHLESSSEGSSQVGEDSSDSELKLEEIGEFFSPEMKRMLSLRRSKKPLLETIVE